MTVIRNHSRHPRAHWFATALILTLSACGGEPEVRTEPVQLAGRIVVPEGLPADGKVQVRLYHAWALEGELRHPLEFIEEFETTVGEYAHAFDYPVDLGEGLAVYAWLDRDGDGVLCTPTERDDAAGLTLVQDFASGDVNADVEIVAPCAGPDWFHPAPE
jgi:hypothetical protein